MTQYAIETVTIVAIIVISIILIIYITILKRNGWLNRRNQFYRCPNQECKKIFQKPAEVKDLSQTPARVYPACPECGTDLRQYFGSSVAKKTPTNPQVSLNQDKPKIISLEKKAEPMLFTEPKRVQTKEQDPIKKAPTMQLVTSRGSQKATNNFECKHFFGYLGNRERQGTIPETCLECPRALECMLSGHKPKDSV